jgi:hypothetical protein
MTAPSCFETRGLVSRHRPPPGRRNAPPYYRLRRTIEYSTASRLDLEGRGVLDTRRSLSSGAHSRDPLAGYDGRGVDIALIAHALTVVERLEGIFKLRRDRDIESLPGGQAGDKPFMV